MDRSKHIFKLSQGEYIAPEKIEAAYRVSGLVQQVFVDGDTLSSFPVAIVIPEPAILHRFLQEKKHGPGKHGDDSAMPVPSLKELCANPESKSLIMEDFKRLGEEAGLKGFEKVSRFYRINLFHLPVADH